MPAASIGFTRVRTTIHPTCDTSLFGRFEYEPGDRLCFREGRPWSTGTGQYLTEDIVSLRAGASNVYQRSADAPSGQFQSRFNGYNFFSARDSLKKIEAEESGTFYRHLSTIGHVGVMLDLLKQNVALYSNIHVA